MTQELQPSEPMSTGHSIRQGFNDCWPVAFSMIPLGLAFGVLMVQIGFAWWWTPVFSIAIYAGSMEFLAISLVTGGVGPISAAIYGLFVNFRHIFYALNYPIASVKGWLARAYGVYALTDEAYAVLASKPDATWTTARVMTIQLLLQSGWILGGILGGLGGQLLPAGLHGFEFALVAMFVVLGIEAFKAYRDYSLPLSAVIAAAVGFGVESLAGGTGSSSSSTMLIAGILTYVGLLTLRFLIPPLDKALTWKQGTDA